MAVGELALESPHGTGDAGRIDAPLGDAGVANRVYRGHDRPVLSPAAGRGSLAEMMTLTLPYIVAGVVTALACFAVQIAVGSTSVAAEARSSAPVQWQQQSVYVESQGTARERTIRELSQQILASQQDD